jgi:tetratricopeptide (TPR) repeat protein
LKNILLIIYFFLFSVVISTAQTDLEKIISVYDKCIASEDTLCLAHFLEIVENINFDSAGIIQALNFGNRIQNEKGLDASKLVFNLASNLAEDMGSDKLISDALERLATIELYKGNLEKAHLLYMEALTKALSSNDRYTISKSKINLGHVYRKKGEIDTSAYYYRQGILELQNDNNEKKIGYPYMFLGILYGVNGQNDKSIENFRTSYNYFNIVRDTSMSASVAVNLANTFLSMNQLDSAEHYLNLAIPQFEKLEDTRSLLNAETQLGRLYLYQSRWELSLSFIKKATQKAASLDLKPQLIYNNRLLSEIYLEQRNYKEALNSIFIALELCKETGLNEEYPLILDHISKVYLRMEDYEKAYEYQRESNQISDSIFTEQKKLKVEELEVKYEAEKREKEVAKLSAETANSKLRKAQLLWAISIITVSLLSLIGFLIFKQRKNKQLLIKERDLEIGQRKTIELENKILLNEIELKNKELVSNTLLISKKNSFLESLKQKVKSKDSKLQRLINQELESESEWNTFVNVFNNTHGAFVDNLNEVHSSLSTTEIRLSCLMKMNMSSKEIASVLNISYEGVKKAKYRLKKKLQIQEGIDLVSFINQI